MVAVLLWRFSTASSARTVSKEVVMAKRSLVSEAVEQYVFNVIARETPLQKRLRAETTAAAGVQMQIGPDQGAMMAMLVHLIGAR